MGHRQQPPELEFGSDSFLDVVCNIVGILIILIVVVSVKVQRQPNHDPKAIEAQLEQDAQRKSVDKALSERTQQKEETLKSKAELTAKLDDLQSQRSLSTIDIEKLEVSINELEDLIRLAEAKKEKSQSKLDSVVSSRSSLAVKVASLQKTLESKNQELKTLAAAMTEAETEQKTAEGQLRQSVVETQRLTEVLETIQKTNEPTDKLQHRLMPVTRRAEKGEIHFRIANGHISEIPIDGLVQRIQRQARTAGYRDLKGIVGPVGGYRMTYELERVGSNGFQALQSGEYSLSLQLTRWQIEPDASLVEEKIDAAVRPGSQFRNVLQAADPDAVATMWIYPDSFDGFHSLREVAHGLNLRVAARPLPFGQPIIGTPSGSKSNAQ